MYSFSVNAFRSTFEDRRMLKTLVEVTGDAPRFASCLCVPPCSRQPSNGTELECSVV